MLSLMKIYLLTAFDPEATIELSEENKAKSLRRASSVLESSSVAGQTLLAKFREKVNKEDCGGTVPCDELQKIILRQDVAFSLKNSSLFKELWTSLGLPPIILLCNLTDSEEYQNMNILRPIGELFSEKLIIALRKQSTSKKFGAILEKSDGIFETRFFSPKFLDGKQPTLTKPENKSTGYNLETDGTVTDSDDQDRKLTIASESQSNFAIKGHEPDRVILDSNEDGDWQPSISSKSKKNVAKEKIDIDGTTLDFINKESTPLSSAKSEEVFVVSNEPRPGVNLLAGTNYFERSRIPFAVTKDGAYFYAPKDYKGRNEATLMQDLLLSGQMSDNYRNVKTKSRNLYTQKGVMS